MSTRRRILIVPDQGGMSASVQEAMSKETFEPILVKGLQNVLGAVRDHRPGLVLFDVLSLSEPLKELLWKMEELRSTQTIRKIILSATGAVDEKVSALEMGADDFLTKPISSRELGVRILAAMRASDSLDYQEGMQSLGSMRLYRESMEVSIGEILTKLSPREFNMLAYMMDHAGQVLSRMDLLETFGFPLKRCRSIEWLTSTSCGFVKRLKLTRRSPVDCLRAGAKDIVWLIHLNLEPQA